MRYLRPCLKTKHKQQGKGWARVRLRALHMGSVLHWFMCCSLVVNPWTQSLRGDQIPRPSPYTGPPVDSLSDGTIGRWWTLGGSEPPGLCLGRIDFSLACSFFLLPACLEASSFPPRCPLTIVWELSLNLASSARQAQRQGSRPNLGRNIWNHELKPLLKLCQDFDHSDDDN